jgi:leucyl-tRNA---protein transferase
MEALTSLKVLRTDEPCPYLQGRQAHIEYRVIEQCSPEAYQTLLERGWRRFGRVFFRPQCRDCQECRSLRVPVDAYRPNRSRRRTLRANEDIQVRLARPSLTPAHLELYHRFHQHRTAHRGWRPQEVRLKDYWESFVDNHGDFGHELLYFLEDRLVAVALTDLLPGAVSAVYSYHDPALSDRALGVFSILTQLELTRRRGVPYLYLGFWVEGNRSMRYKEQYQPHEILRGRPALETAPEWGPPPNSLRTTEPATGPPADLRGG